MKIIMFAGADAMTDMSASLSALAVPEVQELLKQFGFYENLAEHFEKMYMEPFPALAASILTQVGLFEAHTRKFGNKFSLVGCSMGDLAKLICSKVMNIDVALEGIEQFTKGLKDVELGALVHVKTLGLRDQAFFDCLKAYDLQLAMDQTPNDCLIAGRDEDLKNWQANSKIAKESKLQIILPYPLHSSLMVPAYRKLEYIFAKYSMNAPTMPILSSIEPGKILNVESIPEDLKQNILGQVRWQECFAWMSDVLKATEFVNIGPVATLKILGGRIKTQAKVSIVDTIESDLSR